MRIATILFLAMAIKAYATESQTFDGPLEGYDEAKGAEIASADDKRWLKDGHWVYYKSSSICMECDFTAGALVRRIEYSPLFHWKVDDVYFYPNHTAKSAQTFYIDGTILTQLSRSMSGSSIELHFYHNGHVMISTITNDQDNGSFVLYDDDGKVLFTGNLKTDWMIDPFHSLYAKILSDQDAIAGKIYRTQNPLPSGPQGLPRGF